eukprot:CAMPEP_0115872494 /NCGR_PEP_ID=MMETSP0287-20121206/23455_1 /TAXON_ID=412157 /ORGANISM="Chrysochromulina rotalis, Strain UIO044" /LENGTH=325 /DNA_ID=CAMNT_0003327417 /DNA_START=93 /DNA_END=1070 /DNA_ORIENTATION=+
MACITSREYIPSSLENWWHAHVDLYRTASDWKTACTALRSPANASLIEAWLETVERRRQKSDKTWSQDALSFHRVSQHCGNRHTTLKLPIEPLVSFLRHPYDICTKKLSARVDKSYIMLPTRAEIHPSNASRSAFFFDAGASTWNHGLGGSSLSWFVAQYEAHVGIKFSRIFAWEAKQHSDTDIQRGVPRVLRPPHMQVYRTPPEVGCCSEDKFSYFNLPVSAELGARTNPLSWVQAVAGREDYVVFKLDIDTPKIERQIVDQILGDPEVANLIDEMYWEHTVSRAPKITRNWPTGMSAPQETLEESYDLFTRLRRAGIRAHPWV